MSKLGKIIDITDSVCIDLELFTIRVIYNDQCNLCLNEARAKKWIKLKKKNTLILPPDIDSFEQHLKRANYVAYTWLNYNNPDPPNSPLNHGYMLLNNEIAPVSHTLPVLPPDEQLTSGPIDENESDVSDTESEGEYSDID